MRDESALVFASTRVESTLTFAGDRRASAATAPPAAAPAETGGAAGGAAALTLSATALFAVVTSTADDFAFADACKESIILVLVAATSRRLCKG